MNMLALLTGLAVALGTASPPATATDPKPAPSPTPPAIRVLSDVTLPPAFEWASDVRWASDKSVYLGVAVEGTFEVSLDPAGPPPKEMIPGRSKPGGFRASKPIAASSQYLAAAGPALAVTWRRLADPDLEEEPFDFIQGIDLQENRLAILGARRDEKGGYGTDGAIAWIGTLDKKLTDLRPILYDIAGPGTPNMGRCGSLPAGAARFLPEGSLLVVPGVQPGISLFDGGGKLIRTWDTASLGIDSTCGGMTDDVQAQKIMVSDSRFAWLNQWRTVDTVLPLPGGPGLLVRSVENGHTRWDLKILKLDGTARTFALPFEGGSEFFHLKGDVRAGKIVFVLYETVFDGGEKNRPTPPRLIVAERAWPDELPAMQVLRLPTIEPRPESSSLRVAPAVAPSPPATKPVSRPPIPATPAAIGVVSDIDLPPAFEWASDVRWASDNSVYLGVSVVGAFEISLDPAGPPPKEMIPGRSKPGGFWASQKLAASSSYLVAAGPALVLTWRRLEDPTREEEPFDNIQAIDLQGSRFAIVGGQRDKDGKGGYGSDGAIAWIGTLDKKLADLRPILYDVKGPGVPTMNRCGSAPLGAVRFLPDGSLVVIPGVQPGVNLYDASGKLVRTWDTPTLGVDTDCLGLTEEQWRYFWGHPQERQVWLNQHRMVDTVLPFQEGPGLVVRRVEEGRTRWELKLLRLGGTVETYGIPIEGSNEFFNLEGDLRAGKIVFILHEALFYGGGKDHPTPPRLIVASPPMGLAN